MPQLDHRLSQVVHEFINPLIRHMALQIGRLLANPMLQYVVGGVCWDIYLEHLLVYINSFHGVFKLCFRAGQAYHSLGCGWQSPPSTPIWIEASYVFCIWPSDASHYLTTGRRLQHKDPGCIENYICILEKFVSDNNLLQRAQELDMIIEIHFHRKK